MISAVDRALCARKFHKNGENSAVILVWVMQMMRQVFPWFGNESKSLKRPAQQWINQNPADQGYKELTNAWIVIKISLFVTVRTSPFIRKLASVLNLHIPTKSNWFKELKFWDSSPRFQFLSQLTERFPSINNILFSNEAHFYLNEHVNKQNCPYWSTTDPKNKHQKPLHSPEVAN